jgi:hypothetical protein
MEEEAERIAIRLWLGLSSVEDVDRWAEDFISASNEVDPAVYDILEADREIKAELFTDFVRTRLGFEFVSRKGVKYVEDILDDLCQQVLRREIAVPRFCKIVFELDAAFISPMGSSIPFPEGLFDLWNACDWCDNGWTLDNQPYLEESVEAARQKILQKIGDGKS